MNKKELATKVAKKAGLTMSQARKSIEAAFATIKESVETGNSVTLKGFGSFSVGHRIERQGVNPTTKQRITIPACKVMKFKASKNVEIG